MPSYSVSDEHVHDKIAELEASGERIVKAVPIRTVSERDGSDAVCWMLITERTDGYRAAPGSVETR